MICVHQTTSSWTFYLRLLTASFTVPMVQELLLSEMSINLLLLYLDLIFSHRRKEFLHAICQMLKK